MEAENIRAEELRERLENGGQLNLLDVREPIEFTTYNIGGINIPLGKLIDRANNLTILKTKKLLLFVKWVYKAKPASKSSAHMVLETCVTRKAACWLCINCINLSCYV